MDVNLNNQKIDLLWKFSEQQREIGQNNGRMRTTFSNIIIVLTSGIFGLSLYKNGDTLMNIFLFFFVIVINLYALLVIKKLYERSSFHNNHANFAMDEIENILGEKVFEDVRKKAREKTRNDYPYLNTKNIHKVWMWMHIIIASCAFLLIIYTIINYIIVSNCFC